MQDIAPDEPPKLRVSLRLRKESQFKKTPFRSKVKLPKVPKHNFLSTIERESLNKFIKAPDDKARIQGYIHHLSAKTLEAVLKKGGWIWDKVTHFFCYPMHNFMVLFILEFCLLVLSFFSK